MSSSAASPSHSSPLSLKRRFFSLRRVSRTPPKLPLIKDAAASTSSDAESPHDSLRADVKKAFDNISQLIKASAAPVHARYPYLPANDPPPPKGGLLADLKTIGFQDVETLLQSFYAQTKGVQNDNDMLLEHLVQLLSKLPANSKEGRSLTDGLINQLWGSLPHPPVASLGAKYKYREPDGSYNSIRDPNLGAANSPYARSARPSALQNIALPSPEQIFDELMARGGEFEPHPYGLSSMLFYLGTIIIHDLFRTDHADFNNSMTSSYLDLAPLYGSNLDEQKEIRTFKDGGIKPDCFSEKRILGFPPGVGVLLIMFNRFHNFIVTNLAVINENDRFKKPTAGLSEEATKAAWAKYDNDLFQTARLINCGLYANCILKDYLRTILSLNRSGSTWDLDPRSVETKTLFNTPAPEGVGNQVSAEFNLIYRWHSAISERDDKWTQSQFQRLFPNKNPEDISSHDLIVSLTKWEESLSADPLERTFANLTRQANGTFNDDDLVNILVESIEDVAGSFGANRVPKILRSVEMLGIVQARAWNLASLNEFREFFGLTRHKTFEDVNPDPVVAEKLRNLYDSPDGVELYPGLVAEKAKPPMTPGSGICLNFTSSRAILSDAVGLVRGDRFYTTDYTPKNLTNWGFAEVNYDLTVNQGQVIYKLFLNAFPNHFKGNSIYAHFPFVIPCENEVILKHLGTADLYDWSKPQRVPEIVDIDSYKAAVKILNDKENFKVTWGPAIERLVQHPNKHYGASYCLAGDKPANAESRKTVMRSLYPQDWHGEVKKFYENITASLLKQYSYKMGNAYQVDVVRDVAALANTHFSAGLFSLPLKTEKCPHGIYTEQELYQVLSILFMSIFYDLDPMKSFVLQNAAKTLTQQLGNLVLFNVEVVSKAGIVAEIASKIHGRTELTEYGIHMIQRLLESGQNVKDVVWTNLMPTAASMVANQCQLLSQVLDYYLGDGAKYLKELNKLAKLDTTEADELLLRYFLEGSRLRGTAGLFRDAAVDVTIVDGTTEKVIPKGHRLLVNIVEASKDPSVFPDPAEVRLDRDVNSYLHYGWGPHQCAGFDASKTALTTMFKAIMKLDGLRRAPGLQGGLKKTPAPFGYTSYMTSDWSSYYPIPTTMKIQWDGPAP